MRYTVNWIERCPAWVDVEADSPEEAKQKVLDGDVIEGSQDSDPGKMDKRTLSVDLSLHKEPDLGGWGRGVK